MKKWIFGGAVLLITGIIATGIFYPNLYEDELKTVLEQQVLIQTDSTYSVKLDKLDISFWGRTISADSLMVTPLNEFEPIKSVTAGSIQIQGIKWYTLLFDRFASFGTILIGEPFVEIYSRPLEGDTFEEATADTSTENTPSDLPLSKFKFEIRNGKARLVEPSGRTEVMLEQFNLLATQVDIGQVLDGSRLPFLEELILTGKNLTWRLDEELYRFEVGEFSFDRVRGEAIVREAALIPVLPRYEFSRIKGYSTDRIELNIDQIKMKNLSIDSLYIPRIDADEIIIEQGSLDIFKNKTIPSRSAIGYRALLSEIFSKTEVQVGIQKIDINNFDVSYTEHKEGAKAPGKVFFEDITGSIKDLNTIGHPEFDSDTLALSVNTKFMNATNLNLNVRYPLFDKSESHHVWGNMERLDTEVVNSTLLHLAFVETKSGVINSMKFDFKVDDKNAQGTLLLDYNDLSLTFLNSDDSGDKNLGTRFKSFLANTIGINSDNTGDISPKEIDYTWDKRKGVFGYWWQALLSGIKNTIR